MEGSPKASAQVLRSLHRDGVLSAAQTAALEDLLRSRLPWREQIGRILLALGAGLFAAGVIFFFAYNWQALSAAAKFAIIESGIALAALAGWWVGLERLGGKLLVFLAAVLTGVFLAVHGQTYQTGADTWLLFAAWAALILPWVALARLPALWVFWLLVLNLAVALSWDASGFLHLMGGDPLWPAVSLALTNALALAAWELASARGWQWMDDGWVRALIIVATFGFLTLGVCRLVVADSDDSHLSAWRWLVPLWLAACALAYWFYRQVRPALPCLTTVILSVCIVVVTAIGRLVFDDPGDEVGAFFLMAFIVLAIFCGAVFWLRRVARVVQARRGGAPL